MTASHRNANPGAGEDVGSLLATSALLAELVTQHFLRMKFGGWSDARRVAQAFSALPFDHLLFYWFSSSRACRHA